MSCLRNIIYILRSGIRLHQNSIGEWQKCLDQMSLGLGGEAREMMNLRVSPKMEFSDQHRQCVISVTGLRPSCHRAQLEGMEAENESR